MSQSKGQFITPPPLANGRKLGKFTFDPKAIERAEAALKGLSSQFEEWMDSELARLDAKHKEWRANPTDNEAGEALYRCMHDLKGLGTTYEYPVVTAIAELGSKITETTELRTRIPAQLIDAHVKAIEAAVRQKIKTVDHPISAALLKELGSKVAALI
jgi:chemotaxis protein histidine kinase CheA